MAYFPKCTCATDPLMCKAPYEHRCSCAIDPSKCIKRYGEHDCGCLIDFTICKLRKYGVHFCVCPIDVNMCKSFKHKCSCDINGIDTTYGVYSGCKFHRFSLPSCSCDSQYKICNRSLENQIKHLNPHFPKLPDIVFCKCPQKCMAEHHAIKCVCNMQLGWTPERVKCKVYGHHKTISINYDNIDDDYLHKMEVELNTFEFFDDNGDDDGNFGTLD